MISIVHSFYSMGARGCTITGGGEPLLYSHIKNLIGLLSQAEIKVGLVTNGTQFNGKASVFERVTWCRVSSGDRKPFAPVVRTLERTMEEFPRVDWCISYVVTDQIDVSNIDKVVEFVLGHPAITHIRLVSDILTGGDYFTKFKTWIVNRWTAIARDQRFLFQDRSSPEPGSRCWICWLKPVIGADRRIYTCCGSQYAFGPDSEESRKMSSRLDLGDALELQEIWKKRAGSSFDGSICRSCYYQGYNRALEMLQAKLIHVEFP